MKIVITNYNACCNIGNNIDEIYHNALEGINDRFELRTDIISGTKLRVGTIKKELPVIDNTNYSTRCNQLLLECIKPLEQEIKILIQNYSPKTVGVIAATTNTGVEEFAKTRNSTYAELGNPAKFIKDYFGLEGFYTTVSTACSSGIKSFSLARDLLKSGIIDACIVLGSDSLTKSTLYGFQSLEILTDTPSVPFDRNRNGINIGEGSAIFIIEKDKEGIEIKGIGESSDTYHITTPNPTGEETILAIEAALSDAGLKPDDIDYINLHGTGTVANDLMEANAIYKIFQNNVPASSTKQMTGHCLGCASSIEAALCCHLLKNFDGKLFPHICNEYDNSLPKVKLTDKNNTYKKCNICMCNSFGFGGTNTILILGN